MQPFVDCDIKYHKRGNSQEIIELLYLYNLSNCLYFYNIFILHHCNDPIPPAKSIHLHLLPHYIIYSHSNFTILTAHNFQPSNISTCFHSLIHNKTQLFFFCFTFSDDNWTRSIFHWCVDFFFFFFSIRIRFPTHLLLSAKLIWKTRFTLTTIRNSMFYGVFKKKKKINKDWKRELSTLTAQIASVLNLLLDLICFNFLFCTEQNRRNKRKCVRFFGIYAVIPSSKLDKFFVLSIRWAVCI